MKSFEEKVHAAARAYLEQKGYDIIDENWKAPDGSGFDIIAVDGEDRTMVFCAVKGREKLEEDGVFDCSKDDRATCETNAYLYMSSHEVTSGCRVRFDILSITGLNNGTAFLRHHKNAYCLFNEQEDC